MNEDEVRRLISVMQEQQALLLALGGERVAAAEMRRALPTLHDLEASMPGLLDAVIGAANGDPEAERKLAAIVDSAAQEVCRPCTDGRLKHAETLGSVSRSAARGSRSAQAREAGEEGRAPGREAPGIAGRRARATSGEPGGHIREITFVAAIARPAAPNRADRARAAPRLASATGLGYL
jgi:hypothetical protein